MILTCPNCATRYFLHDVLVGQAGRSVKCTSCATVWRAQQETPLDLTAAPPGDDFRAPAAEAPAGIAPAAVPGPAALSDLPADKLSKTFRARAQVQRKTREAAATGAIWAGLVAGVVLLIGLGAVFRAQVVRLWPKTATAYAAIGLPVNTTGLLIEQVSAAPSMQDGHPVITVSGNMRNVQERPSLPPPLRVSLLGKGGRTLARRVSEVTDAQLMPGEARPFAVSIVDPPPDASDVEVTFALAAASAQRAAARHTPAPRLRGLATAVGPQDAPLASSQLLTAPEAKPLPQTSPYALRDGKPST